MFQMVYIFFVCFLIHMVSPLVRGLGLGTHGSYVIFGFNEYYWFIGLSGSLMAVCWCDLLLVLHFPMHAFECVSFIAMPGL